MNWAPACLYPPPPTVAAIFWFLLTAHTHNLHYYTFGRNRFVGGMMCRARTQAGVRPNLLSRSRALAGTACARAPPPVGRSARCLIVSVGRGVARVCRLSAFPLNLSLSVLWTCDFMFQQLLIFFYSYYCTRKNVCGQGLCEHERVRFLCMRFCVQAHEHTHAK